MASSSKKGVGDSTASSLAAFHKVDDLVSKPVYGSDAAASWQEFRKDASIQKQFLHRPSAAPRAPLKKADKLGTGLTSWEAERQNEQVQRREAGHEDLNAGYKLFTKKQSQEEVAERKRIKKIEDRIRPEDQEYYLPASTFEGWKFDYVFTTRDGRGTGYFWDGMDSVKVLRGELKKEDIPSSVRSEQEKGDEKDINKETKTTTEDNKPKKKKRKRADAAPVIVVDPNNPREQVAALLERKRQEAATSGKGWETATDPASGKTYYFNRSTNERSWDMPPGFLPPGWTEAKDPSTGKVYYYHTSGKTSWERPTTS